MYADSIAILERLADPRVFLSVLPLLVIFAVAGTAVFYSVFRLLTAAPVRPAPSPQPTVPATATAPQAEPAKIDPNPELETRAREAEAKASQVEAQVTVLTEKLAFATTQLSKEQNLRNELQTKTERLANQFEEVIHEVEHIYHQNLGIAAFQELTQRIGRIREGQPLEPRAENSPAPAIEPPAPNMNPEKLLIAEQSTEIRRLKDVVAFYKEKYGE